MTETDEWPAKSRYEYDPSRGSDATHQIALGLFGCTVAFSMFITGIHAGQLYTWPVLLGVSSFIYMWYGDLIIAAAPLILVQFAGIVYYLVVELGVIG